MYRYNLTKIKVVFLSMCIVCSVMYLSFGSLNNSNIIATDSNISNIKTIILDAGHGGSDGGAVGVNNIYEKDINLEIAKKLKYIFELNGYNVIMTRESDISIHDKNSKTLSQQKKSDIKNRLNIIEQYPNAIVLSIHQNKFSDQSCKGAQIFYGEKNDNSETLAKYIQESFVSKLQPDNQRTIQKDNRNLYLLENAENPIVLVECGFLSNYEDATNLIDDDYQKKIAITIFKGVLDYYKNI